jgi:hypothetical protein
VGEVHVLQPQPDRAGEGRAGDQRESPEAEHREAVAAAGQQAEIRPARQGQRLANERELTVDGHGLPGAGQVGGQSAAAQRRHGVVAEILEGAREHHHAGRRVDRAGRGDR